MRIHCALAFLVALGSVPCAEAQQDSLARERLPGGISLEMPVTWRALPDSQQSQVKRIVDSTLSTATDSVTQAQLRAGHPVILFLKTAPGNLVTSISLNAAPAPGATASSFDGKTPVEVAALLGPMCPSLTSFMEQMGKKVLACDKPFLDQGTAHTIAVTRMVRTGATGFVTVWMAQYPEHDVIYTLSLATLQADEAKYAPLYRTIWRSVQLSQ
jgi:hypothetical protein